MHKVFRNSLRWLTAFGIDPYIGLQALKNFLPTVKELSLLKKQNSGIADKWLVKFVSPNFHDRSSLGGTASGHYFHQDLLVARKIYSSNPAKHVDVGSRIDGFVAHVAVFRKIEVFDIRPSPAKVTNINFTQMDIMNPSSDLSNCCDSLSCLHTLEHFGLGRYGDSIDVEGYQKGFDVLTRMLKPEGILYLSMPIGKERVEFNGERVFSYNRISNLFKDKFKILTFSYVDDSGNLHENIEINEKIFNGFDLNYGCGIFELQKY